MDIGFETIGNACLIFHDRKPVLATDPWMVGPAYFGSWILSHEFPAEQQDHVKQCDYLWISHGHPDHLSLQSLELLRDKKLLLPDHVGGRVARDLQGMGYDITILQDGVWTQLSDRIRVASIANYNQDAVLIIDIDGNLVIDANDAGDRGASSFLRRELPNCQKQSFLACLMGYGDADMINYFTEDGRRVLPAAAQKPKVGAQVQALLEGHHIDNYLPSSSQHRYQRDDSVWVNEYVTPEDAYQVGFESDRHRCLPAFIRYDLGDNSFSEIRPRSNAGIEVPCSDFGDDWSTLLERKDVDALRAYFARFSYLPTFLGYVNFRVGGKDNTIDINRAHQRGVTFETPAQSLMQAIEWSAFDDLLIGNFTKTTLHGDWFGKQGAEALYPHFTPFVTKFGDNGGAYSEDELRAYFADYLRRGFTAFGPEPEEQEMQQALRAYLPA